MSKGSSTPVERGDSRVSSDLWIVPTQRVPGKALSGKYSQPAPCSRVESNRWVPRNPYVPFDGGGVLVQLTPNRTQWHQTIAKPGSFWLRASSHRTGEVTRTVPYDQNDRGEHECRRQECVEGKIRHGVEQAGSNDPELDRGHQVA